MFLNKLEEATNQKRGDSEYLEVFDSEYSTRSTRLGVSRSEIKWETQLRGSKTMPTWRAQHCRPPDAEFQRCSGTYDLAAVFLHVSVCLGVSSSRLRFSYHVSYPRFSWLRSCRRASKTSSSTVSVSFGHLLLLALFNSWDTLCFKTLITAQSLQVCKMQQLIISGMACSFDHRMMFKATRLSHDLWIATDQSSVPICLFLDTMVCAVTKFVH